LSQNETRRQELQSQLTAQLVDKALALVAARGPLEFQAIQAMNPASGYDSDNFDPSDEAEIKRLQDLQRAYQEDDLSGDEQGFIDDLAGIVPEFSRTNNAASGSDS
jgi:hypothetical protein